MEYLIRYCINTLHPHLIGSSGQAVMLQSSKYRLLDFRQSCRSQVGPLSGAASRVIPPWMGRGPDEVLLGDHVHMLPSIPPKYAVAEVVDLLKGKSAIHPQIRDKDKRLDQVTMFRE